MADVEQGGGHGVDQVDEPQVRVRLVRNRRIRPRTVVTAVLVVALVAVVWGQRVLLVQMAQAMSHGSVIPLVAAVACEATRIVFHSLAYTRSFRAIGADVPLRATIPAWFKAVFMNTVLPSGGTSGLAAVVDAARARGVPVGSASSAALFTQTCFYSAMFLVLVVGLVAMGVAGTLTVRDVLLSLLVGGAALVFLALLAFASLRPGQLQRAMRWVERTVVRACRRLRLPRTPKPWADALVRSFSSAARELSRRPREAASVFVAMVVAMSFDLAAFVASGLAFGVAALPALLGGYVTALVFNSFSPTPGGVGVVEGLAAVVLAGYGYPPALALSTVLTYRALMYWIPLAVGGVMMRVTGAFAGGGRGAGEAAAPAGEAPGGARARRRLGLADRLRDVAASTLDRRAVIAGLLTLAVALYQMVASALPRDEAVLEVIRAHLPLAVTLDPAMVIGVAYLVLLCVPGLFIRDQGCWLLTLAALVLLGIASLLAGNAALSIAALLIVLAVLVTWHACFTRHNFLTQLGRLAWVLAYGVAVAILYAAGGMLLMREGITPTPDFWGTVWLGVQSLVTTPTGVQMTERVAWFAGSARVVRLVLSLATLFAVAVMLGQRLVEYRRPDRAAMRAFNRAQAREARRRQRRDRDEERARRARDRARHAADRADGGATERRLIPSRREREIARRARRARRLARRAARRRR